MLVWSEIHECLEGRSLVILGHISLCQLQGKTAAALMMGASVSHAKVQAKSWLPKWSRCSGSFTLTVTNLHRSSPLSPEFFYGRVPGWIAWNHWFKMYQTCIPCWCEAVAIEAAGPEPPRAWKNMRCLRNVTLESLSSQVDQNLLNNRMAVKSL